MVPAPARMLDDGGVEDRVRLVRPALRDTMAGEALAASSWQEAAPEHWRALWEAELKALPTHAESRLWLVSGLLLPLWDRLPTDSVRVRTLTTDAGERLIGRTLGAAQAQALRLALGLGGGVALTAGEVHEAVIGGGTAFALANGWRLARRRAMGALRLEVEGPADTDLPALKRLGCTTKSSHGAPACSCPVRTPSHACLSAGRWARAPRQAETPPLSVPAGLYHRPLPCRSTPTPPPAARTAALVPSIEGDSP